MEGTVAERPLRVRGGGSSVKAAREDAFREFVEGSWHRLLRTAYLLTGDHGAAEDLVQTALMRTYKHWGQPLRDAAEAYLKADYHGDPSGLTVVTTFNQAVQKAAEGPRSPNDIGLAALDPKTGVTG